MKWIAQLKEQKKKLEYLSSDAETLALYKAREDSLHERANMISSAKLEKALEIAKNMMSSGLDIVTISKFTEISVDELKGHLKLQ